MPIFRAPYRFAPLPDEVLHPEWADAVSHDMPLEQGFSGVLRLKVVFDTPVTVGDGRELLTPERRRKLLVTEGEFEDSEPTAPGPTLVSTFRTPGGAQSPNDDLALPGSSLRGPIRSTLELLSFSALELIGDEQFSYRRPGAPDYNSYFTTSTFQGGERHAPNYRAGLLHRDQSSWTIRPCDHARIEQHLALTLVTAKISASEFTQEGSSDRQAWSKHTLFRSHGGAEFRTLHVEPHKAGGNWKRHKRYQKVSHGFGPDTKKEKLYELDYRVATPYAASGYVATSGRLVFTGQAGKKHMEFFFFNPKSSALPVPDAARAAFETLQRGVEKRAKGEQTTWRWLCGDVPPSQPAGSQLAGVPVFYLVDKSGAISHFGVAAMFPILAARRLHDAFPKEFLKSEKPDFADLCFGEIREDAATKRQRGLKARVSFGLARIVEPQRAQVAHSPTVIYSSPKPSFAEAYLRSGGWNDASVKASGPKRYGARSQYRSPKISSDLRDKHKVQSFFEGVAPNGAGAKVTFEFPVRVHNMAPVELGGLLWTLLWGGDAGKRHMIGAGKPHGQGVARFVLEQVKGREWNAATGRLVETAVDHGDETAARDWARTLMRRFADHMDAQMPGANPGSWLATPTMRALLGMATPDSLPSDRDQDRYMTLAEHTEVRKGRVRIPAPPEGVCAGGEP